MRKSAAVAGFRALKKEAARQKRIFTRIAPKSNLNQCPKAISTKEKKATPGSDVGKVRNQEKFQAGTREGKRIRKDSLASEEKD